MKDPYEILGVARAATPDEIPRPTTGWPRSCTRTSIPATRMPKTGSRRSRAPTACCPTPRSGDGSTAARSTLPARRRRAKILRDYAAEGQAYASPSGYADFVDTDDVLAEIFRQQSRRARGSDLHYSLTVDFLDAVNGATKRINLPEGGSLDVTIAPGLQQGQVFACAARAPPHPAKARPATPWWRFQSVRIRSSPGMATTSISICPSRSPKPCSAPKSRRRRPPDPSSEGAEGIEHRHGPEVEGQRRSARRAAAATCWSNSRSWRRRSLTRNWKLSSPPGRPQTMIRAGGCCHDHHQAGLSCPRQTRSPDARSLDRGGMVDPERTADDLAFSEADMARARLIRDLMDDMGVNAEGVGVALHLLDQIHGLRRAMAEVLASIREKSDPAAGPRRPVLPVPRNRDRIDRRRTGRPQGNREQGNPSGIWHAALASLACAFDRRAPIGTFEIAASDPGGRQARRFVRVERIDEPDQLQPRRAIAGVGQNGGKPSSVALEPSACAPTSSASSSRDFATTKQTLSVLISGISGSFRAACVGLPRVAACAATSYKGRRLPGGSATAAGEAAQSNGRATIAARPPTE